MKMKRDRLVISELISLPNVDRFNRLASGPRLHPGNKQKMLNFPPIRGQHEHILTNEKAGN